jgi:EAL domain-containing protein (putative c-di-GMP-specific phosphodiesterase class I)
VENEEQVRLLKEAGCAVIQGYYFSKPVPAADFEELIRKDLETDKE